ncbi:hypothetical protein FRB99_001862 [Tulasnella sp. 403]|nr:hypothetical protein FRB99_001862 [Tulasnella sp. 403]
MQTPYPASFGQPPQSFLNPHQHRNVIQHHQHPQHPPQPTHVAPNSILATPPIQQQQQPSQQPTPPAGLAVPPSVVPQPLASPVPGSSQPQPHSQPQSGTSKLPYGAGGDDDGYTLVFANLDEFQAWREKEEIEQCVDFVKGDVHTSRAMPPRFKEHTKLVCARHVRSGRKKYVKKHPERQRKLPSRKLEGIGCPASISYKTYFDSDTVRASYNSNHSHPTGIENYPFTRRGRKQMASERGSHGGRKKSKPNSGSNENAASNDGGGVDQDDSDMDDTGQDRDMDMGPDDEEHQVEQLTGVVNQPTLQPPPQPPPPQYAAPVQPMYHNPYVPQHIAGPPPPIQQQPLPPNPPPPPTPTQGHPKPPRPRPSKSAASGTAPQRAPTLALPTPQPQPPPPPQQAIPPPQPPPMQPPPPVDNSPERWRWERLTAMFEAIKANSRTYEYPQASLAALEATLVRLTLESPLGGTGS